MKVTMIAGSNRKEAVSTKLIYFMAKWVKEQGHEVQVINLYEFKLPMYSPGGAEEDNVVQFKASLREADAIVLATPEYHGSLSGILKNALDYAGFNEFDSKAVLSVSSAGGPVGVSSLLHMQGIIRNLHGINCPEWVSIGGAAQEFTSEGEPASPDVRMRVERTLGYFLRMAASLRTS